MPSEAWILFTRGELLLALLAVYTEPIGFWFFMIIFGLFEVMLFIKTEGTTIPLIVAMFTSSVMIYLAPAGAHGIPEMLTVSVSLFAVSTAGIIWKVWKGG